ncbi:tRNA (adenosine(37)-N6)-threonylcarbamoyltransferase complex dimerization subunit type 1 TsaB [Agrococcus sp. SL85]|uniref:tRNA (adenosine(37)-N6)-threonylcarbamoyltransferase complex dimerization subunit type 1 TsaB n=1 Tax=Agrococcus sp. SL85 TaxID=2995141 RepID=UPI00226D0250|nr:tRNA (adenosine(37)-N6)-threonylcarbamoyltransferase complex dimerization subunit type 1 TsaB [Agrococcus sp. SL85]WAC67420.1 tRNA (adenosine(37)-N6)-threonylcarbamoyltransferase complex dimerization subunit type 1 TsaB [Agrococcus sp. SL85]
MILAVDTALGTSVAVLDGEEVVFVEHAHEGRRHAELLGPMLERALEGRRERIRLVVAGMGPGAFTGLRVGIVAARAVALGLGVECRGIASHLGVAEGPAQVTTDVRRRERAWSVVEGAVVLDGPHLAPADAVPVAREGWSASTRTRSMRRCSRARPRAAPRRSRRRCTCARPTPCPPRAPSA